MRAGELGDLPLFSGRYWCDWATDPNGPLSRRFKRCPGSGALGEVGSHVVDAAEYVAGPIASVSGARCRRRSPSGRCHWARWWDTTRPRYRTSSPRSRTRTPRPSPSASSPGSSARSR
ncbi:hypothetical protein [Streptomyces sp. AC550_RSS872]|uniref:Gfo/Idh/MocA family protein n=1 Tax=Streptomyces sp. AC550_RSS872 TaxID=2823689 RepID=UPI0035AB7C8A